MAAAAHPPLLSPGRRGLWQAPAILRFWHLASLDAPTVAVVWSFAFAYAARVRITLWFPLLQALVVWTVYVADRLLDVRAAHVARRIAPLRERHHFHWRHRRLLIPLAGLAACAAMAIVLVRMPARARESDSLLGAAALAYFSGVHAGRRRRASHFPPLLKEFLVGVLFATGCALPALSLAGPAQRMLLWPPILFFAALAFLNCRAIGVWESGQACAHIAVFAGLFAFCGALLCCFLTPGPALLVAAGSAAALSLAGLDLARHRMAPLALRAAADLVLLTPLFLFCPSILRQ